jgi:hypothetical protein
VKRFRLFEGRRLWIFVWKKHSTPSTTSTLQTLPPRFGSSNFGLHHCGGRDARIVQAAIRYRF